MPSTTSENPWDNLANYFDTNIDPGQIESNAADNIHICWPVVSDIISTNLDNKVGQKALDFGCGAGSFTSELATQGFQVMGVDSSQAMIDNAINAHGRVAEFKVGDSSLVLSLGKFMLITSIMTLQFIEDVSKTMQELSSTLEDNGLMVISVFNPAYAQNAFEAGEEFFGFDFNKSPTSGTIDLTGDDRVPTFIRDSGYYKQLAEQVGLHLVAEQRPPFSEEFLERYPHPVPTKDSEYLILGFKK